MIKNLTQWLECSLENALLVAVAVAALFAFLILLFLLMASQPVYLIKTIKMPRADVAQHSL